MVVRGCGRGRPELVVSTYRRQEISLHLAASFRSALEKPVVALQLEIVEINSPEFHLNQGINMRLRHRGSFKEITERGELDSDHGLVLLWHYQCSTHIQSTAQ